MMKECYPGTDTEKLEKHIFRMYDTNKVIININYTAYAVKKMFRRMVTLISGSL